MDSYTIETTHWGDDWVAKRTRRLR